MSFKKLSLSLAAAATLSSYQAMAASPMTVGTMSATELGLRSTIAKTLQSHHISNLKQNDDVPAPHIRNLRVNISVTKNFETDSGESASTEVCADSVIAPLYDLSGDGDGNGTTLQCTVIVNGKKSQLTVFLMNAVTKLDSKSSTVPAGNIKFLIAGGWIAHENNTNISFSASASRDLLTGGLLTATDIGGDQGESEDLSIIVEATELK